MRELPEPFKTALEQRAKYEPSIDYRVNNGANDHAWLKKHGYETEMCSDCSYSVLKTNKEHVNGLSASSYGDWGSLFTCLDKDDEAYNLFVQMYEEGVIIPWRLFLYLQGKTYMYNDETKKWKNVDNSYSWHVCENL